MIHDILIEFFLHKIKVRNFIILRSFSDPTIGHHSVGHVTGLLFFLSAMYLKDKTYIDINELCFKMYDEKK